MAIIQSSSRDCNDERRTTEIKTLLPNPAEISSHLPSFSSAVRTDLQGQKAKKTDRMWKFTRMRRD